MILMPVKYHAEPNEHHFILFFPFVREFTEEERMCILKILMMTMSVGNSISKGRI